MEDDFKLNSENVIKLHEDKNIVKGKLFKPLFKQKDNKKDKDDDDEETDNKERSNLQSSLDSPKTLKIFVIILAVLIVIVCIGFIVYQKYNTKNNNRLKVCHEDEIEGYKNQINDMKEKYETNLINLKHENESLISRLSSLQKDYDENITMKNNKSYNNNDIIKIHKTKPQQKENKKHISQSEEENNMNEDDEYYIEHKNFEDAPIKQQKKQLNKRQALKNHINNGAKEAYDRKQMINQQIAENQAKEIEDMNEEQINIQHELGLSREINEEKLNKIIEEEEQKLNNQQTNLDDIDTIDPTLIV